MDGMNWYAYCNNNPVNLIDPDGRNAIVAIDKSNANGAGHALIISQIGNGSGTAYSFAPSIAPRSALEGLSYLLLGTEGKISTATITADDMKKRTKIAQVLINAGLVDNINGTSDISLININLSDSAIKNMVDYLKTSDNYSTWCGENNCGSMVLDALINSGGLNEKQIDAINNYTSDGVVTPNGMKDLLKEVIELGGA